MGKRTHIGDVNGKKKKTFRKGREREWDNGKKFQSHGPQCALKREAKGRGKAVRQECEGDGHEHHLHCEVALAGKKTSGKNK